MKIALEFTGQLLRKANAVAAERGQSFNEFVEGTLREKLALGSRSGRVGQPEWMQGFGKLKYLHEGNRPRAIRH